MPANQGGILFKYKRIGNIIRPLIRIEITPKKGVDGVPCDVLVDSGADFCIIKAEIGEILGFDITSGDKFSYKGISGSESTGYLHSVWFDVKGNWVNSPVVFSYDIPKGGHQVVGQSGFFNHFKVNFDYKKETVVLRTK